MQPVMISSLAGKPAQDQTHLDIIVGEAQEIVDNVLQSAS